MSDDSDDGYLPGESFFINEINDKENQDNVNDDEKYRYNYNCNNYENYSEKNYFNEIHSINENINNESEFKDKYNEKSYCNKYSYYSRNYIYYDYDDNYNNDYRFYNKYNYYLNKKRKFSNTLNIPKNKTYKGIDNYLSSFAINFKSWLLKTICEEKKNIIFDNNKKINKEIIDSINSHYIFEKKDGKNKKENFKLDIKDIEIQKIISRDINVNFKIIISEEIDLFFIKKYIEIKVKGEMFYNDVAKFHFQVKKYQLSLFDEILKSKGAKNNDNIIINYEKKEDRPISDILELDLKYKNEEESKNSTKSKENNEKSIGSKEGLKYCLNELMEIYYGF